ncbi:MAG: dihydrolipoyl dehydrogenase [Thermoplasmataceae archaeon]
MDFDVIVIGAGPGGYATAIRLGQRGKKVLVIEKDKIGGECLNYGCIPSKALIELAHSMHYLRTMPGFTGQMGIDMEKWQDWKWGFIKKLTGGVETLLRSYGATVIKGNATILDRTMVSVNGEIHRCVDLVIATGSSPVTLPGMDGVMFNREVLDLKKIPKTMVIIGGGYIGIELGTAFAKLGTKVTIVEMTDGILPGVDRELVKPVERKLRELNVDIMVSTKVTSVERSDGFRVSLSNGSSLSSEEVLLTVGRKPNTSGFGLENLGLEMDHGFIKTDRRKRTSVDHVYALGDVTGSPMLAHKAFYEAQVVADNISGIASEVDYRAIPYVIYSDPEIAYTGTTGSKVSSFPVGANGRALGMNSTLGTFRIYADDRGTIVGSGVAAPHASEVISEMTLSVEAFLNAMDIGLTIHPHPTISEGIQEAAEGIYGKPLHFKPRD